MSEVKHRAWVVPVGCFPPQSGPGACKTLWAGVGRGLFEWPREEGKKTREKKQGRKKRIENEGQVILNLVKRNRQ